MTTIEELNNKIDHLTQLVLTLQETINQQQKSQTNVTIESEMIEPKISLETWLQNTQMADIYINTLFENGCVSAFQKFILDHHEKARLPFAYKNNKLYVCNNNGKWILYDENIPKIMVEKTWKKFLNYYLNSYTEIEVEENIADKKKSMVLKMRQNLCEIKKNKELVGKWLKKV